MVGRFLLPVLGLIAVGLIALSLVWPQGLGAPSPPPFGAPMTSAVPPANAQQP